MISTLKKKFGKNNKEKRYKILILDNCSEDLESLQEEFMSIPHNLHLITLKTNKGMSEVIYQIETEKPALVVIDPSLGPNVLYPLILTLIRCHFKNLDIISFSRANLNGHSEKFNINSVVHKNSGFPALIQEISKILNTKQPGNANA